jgi:hypothetical protein
MAEMGPWILTRIDVLDRRSENCQRCGTSIRYVWVMEKQTEPKEVWRIGSECGPTLEQVSQLLWETTTKPFKGSVRHMATLERLAEWERDYPDCRPPHYELGWAESQRATIAAGGLTPHQRRVLGSHISRAEKSYKAALYRRYGSKQ